MIIEKNKNELIIKLNKNKFNTKTLKNIVDYLEYQEAISTSKAKQEDIDELAREVNKKWWEENQYRFTK